MMKTMPISIRHILFAAALFLTGMPARAQLAFDQFANGMAINTCTLTVSDPARFTAPPAGHVYRNDNPVVDVILELKDNQKNFYPNNWSLLISYTIDLCTTASSCTTQTGQLLSITYDKNKPYKDISIKSYPNFKKGTLRVNSALLVIQTPGGPVSGSIPANTALLNWEDIELRLRYTPDYVYSNASTNTSALVPKHSGHPSVDFCAGVLPLNKVNEMVITWPAQLEAQSYDFEWVFVDIPQAAFSDSVNIDWRNAARVNVSTPSFKIPLAYPRGKIVYRVRSVSKEWGNSVYYFHEGPWSFGNGVYEQTITPGTPCYFNYCGFEPQKNWNYVASYIEEAKLSEKLDFLDATGRTRRSITYDYAAGRALISKTYYDKQGRAAIRALPVPVVTKGNDFYAAYTDNFDHSSFDHASALTNSPGMSSTQPAAQYYSAANPFLPTATGVTVQALSYVPDAEGYPFVQTKFKNDGSGRPDATTVPGPNNRIGSGHESRFYYGSVDGQQLLDRLFGNEIGFSEHYKRNMSVDPNGVTSVTYVDGSGRVIASALAGSTAMENLENITSSNTSVTVNLLENLQTGSDGSINNTKELLVPVAGTYSFHYSLSGSNVPADCNGDGRPCRYDVRFRITDEIGTAMTLTYNATSVTEINLTGVTAQSPALAFTATLPVGKYTVQKNLRLSETSVDAYVGELEAKVRAEGPGPDNRCIPQTFEPTECLDCREKCERVYVYVLSYNGTTDSVWIAEGGSPLYTKNSALHHAFPDDIRLDVAETYIHPIRGLIRQCKALCDAPAPEVNLSECDILRQVMLGDVSPGGQYFDNHPATLNNPAATQATKDRWLDGFVPLTVKNELFTRTGAASWEALRGVWVDSLAKDLLPYHPEFCAYDYFCRVVDQAGDSCCKKGLPPPANIHANSGTYDMAMHTAHTDAYALASANTFFDPLDLNQSGSVAVVPSAYVGRCENRDPYFCDNPQAYIQMTGYLTEYIENPWAGGYFTIWDVLDDDGSSYTAANPAQQGLLNFLRDLHIRFDTGGVTKYQFFRAYYQGRKKQIIQNAYPAWASENCNTCTNFTATACRNCVSSGTSPECRECWLSSLDDTKQGVVSPGLRLFACSNATTPGTFSPSGFYIRYPYIAALNGEAVAEEDLCEPRCMAYANQWVAQLSDAWLGCQFPAGGITQPMRNYLYNAFYTYAMQICAASDIRGGEAPEFLGSQASLDSIVTAFKSTYGISICPTVYIPVADSKLPCACANLGEAIVSAQALKSPYVNPFHYARLGISVDLVVNRDSAAAYLTRNLNELGGTYSFTPNNIKKWLDGCTRRDSSYFGGFPVELTCSASGLSPTSCDSVNTPIDRIVKRARFEEALARLLADYRSSIRSTCLANLYTRETFTTSYTLNEFQYTLYYYDRAGNLTKTVPPAGVAPLGSAAVTASVSYRNANYTSDTYSHTAPGAPNPNFKRPDHRLVTNYKYNSLEQVTEQTTPDAGMTKFWYDAFGRLVISQSARQRTSGYLSYTRYDRLGRIVETGETYYGSGTFDEKNVADTTWLSGFYTSSAPQRRQVTYTRYDEPQTGTNLPVQAQLRNRVSSSYYFETAPTATLTNYVHATHYSYDVHGNVSKSIQDFPFLNQFGMRFCETEYEYELVGGNVKKVSYRKGQNDAFYHRYQYDKDSRLVTVQTSRDGKTWDTDAKYFYRWDGPLYRTETGEKNVQGTDYAQTVQGWNKAVNAQRIDPGTDMGKDGLHVLTTGDNHHLFARDAFGYTLTYFNGDYKRIGSSQPAFEPDLFAGPMGASIMGQGSTQNPRGQYNGNIAALVTALRDHSEAPVEELGQVFRYDQLYRLSSSRTFVRANGASFTWTGIAQTNNRWATNYTYDANGNIRTLQRYNEATTAALMDNLVYAYDETGGRLNKNRLYNVNDATGTSSSTVDDYRVNNTGYLTSNPTGTGHFGYDESGNLVRDKGEAGELNIEWNVYGKVSRVTRTSGTKADLEFYYDAAGRRVMKIAKPHGGTKTQWKYTIFAYDAGGQVMAEYDIAYSGSTYTLSNTGHMLYGAAKLGRTRRRVPVKTGVSASYTEVSACSSCATAGLVAPIAAGADTAGRYPGLKQYEFGNHLGNILVTVSDRKLSVDDGTYSFDGTTLTKHSASGDGKLDYYLPDVLTATDYYPGGMPLPGRTFEGSSCTTVSNVSVTTLRNDAFTGTTASYVALAGVTLSNPSGTALLVTKPAALTGTWGARSPNFSLTEGLNYDLSFVLNLAACNVGFETAGWRIVNAGTSAIVAQGFAGTGNMTGSFIAPAGGGTFYLEIYRTTQLAGACSFTLDDVKLTQTTYTHTTTCSTGVFDAYAWGHNGQLKDNELYGNNMAYTAEYWEYDSRLLRRWNTDPIDYEWQSAYACFNNNPIYYADPLGLEGTNGDGGGDKSKDGLSRTEKNPKGEDILVGENVPMSEDKSSAQAQNGTWVYEQGLGYLKAGEAPSVASGDAPAQPQDGAESGTESGWMGKATDFALNGSAVYQIANGNYGDAAWAAFPAAKIAYDGFTGTPRIWYNLYQGDISDAAGIHLNNIVQGGSLMLGIRAPKFKINGKTITDAAKKFFTRGVQETGEVLAGAVDDVAKGGNQAIKGFTQHAAAESAITRGFKTADILKIAREGTQEVIRNGTQIRYTLQSNSIVVQQTGRNAGKVVTVFSNAPGTANGLGKGFFIPWK